jgi:hypothetical protein
MTGCGIRLTRKGGGFGNGWHLKCIFRSRFRANIVLIYFKAKANKLCKSPFAPWATPKGF